MQSNSSNAVCFVTPTCQNGISYLLENREAGPSGCVDLAVEGVWGENIHNNNDNNNNDSDIINKIIRIIIMVIISTSKTTSMRHLFESLYIFFLSISYQKMPENMPSAVEGLVMMNEVAQNLFQRYVKISLKPNRML